MSDMQNIAAICISATMFCAGVLLGFGLGKQSEDFRRIGLRFLLIVTCLGVVGVGCAAAYFVPAGAPRTLTSTAFAAAALASLLLLIELSAAETLEFQSNWGGLGGGLGGWRASGPLVMLILVLAFAGAAMTTVLAPIASAKEPDEKASSSTSSTLTLKSEASRAPCGH